MGDMIFDRTKYDIKYRSGNYFENLAEKLIYDDVHLNVRLVVEFWDSLLLIQLQKPDETFPPGFYLYRVPRFNAQNK